MFDLIGLIFVIAAMLGYFNARVLKLPEAIGVMTAALLGSILVIAFESLFPGVGLATELRELMASVDFAEALMHGMLSFLLFAGALHVDLNALRQWTAPILILATVTVLISTFAIGVASWVLFDLLGFNVPFLYCLVFGALISPTDPVAVLGIMRKAGAPADIETKVIGESLFNDGAGIVLFSILLSVALATTGTADTAPDGIGAVDVLLLLAKEVGGGIVLALALGMVAFLAMRSIDAPNLEALMCVALVMALTGLCFRIHASAPLAAVVAGLLIGNRGRSEAMDLATRERVDAVWSFIDDVLNIVLFLLIGLEIVVLEITMPAIIAGALCFITVLLGRAVGVALPFSLFKRRRELRPGTRRILIWGGLRGGVSVALALALPEFEGRSILVAATYVVVIISVLGQGLTIGKLIERLVPPEDRKPVDAHH